MLNKPIFAGETYGSLFQVKGMYRFHKKETTKEILIASFEIFCDIGVLLRLFGLFCLSIIL